MAEAAGLLGLTAETPAQVRPMIAQALQHDGPALVEVLVNRQELSMPPTITAEQAEGLQPVHAQGRAERARRRNHRSGEDQSVPVGIGLLLLQWPAIVRRSKRSQQDKLSRVSGPAEPQSSEPSSHNETVNAAHIRWLSVLLVVCGCVVYANSLTNPFVFDDEVSIVGNQQIRNLQSLSSVLSPERELPTSGRPLANLSLAINYAAGGLQPSGYHATNIALHHTLCALVIRHCPSDIGNDGNPRVRTHLNLHGRETAVAFCGRLDLDGSSSQFGGSRLSDGANRVVDGTVLPGHAVRQHSGAHKRRAIRHLAGRRGRGLRRRHVVQGIDGHCAGRDSAVRSRGRV